MKLYIIIILMLYVYLLGSREVVSIDGIFRDLLYNRCGHAISALYIHIRMLICVFIKSFRVNLILISEGSITKYIRI